jgi:hypothetical protein
VDKQALILDGGLGDGVDTRGAGMIADELLRRDGWQATRLTLREIDIAPCLGCFSCWIKTPGVCVMDDAGRDVARQMVHSDLLVYLTPLTFGGYSSELKKALDRSIPNISPFFRLVKGEVHHVKRYARYPRIVGIGVCSDDRADLDEEELFETLIHRNAINFHAPADGACVISMTEDDDVRRRRIERTLGKVIGS